MTDASREPYDNGGWLPAGVTVVRNATGQPEPIAPPDGQAVCQDREPVPGPPVPETAKRPAAEAYWKRPTL